MDMGKPKIRFNGYTEDWEQRKLGDIYGSIGNAFVGTATPYYVEQGHFYLESNNVKDGQINHNTEIFINDEFYEKQKDIFIGKKSYHGEETEFVKYNEEYYVLKNEEFIKNSEFVSFNYDKTFITLDNIKKLFNKKARCDIMQFAEKNN